ncbi:unnamed protein product [Rhodiola kirilowii]
MSHLMWIQEATSIALSTAEAEYMAAARLAAPQLLWIKQQLSDYGVFR